MATQVERLKARFKALYDDASDHRARWKELQAYVNPAAGKYLDALDTTVQAPDRSSIINNVPGLALRVMASGLHGGLTSPARPWFRLAVPNPDLQQDPSVQQWLSDVRDRMLRIYAKSNFYTGIHTIYSEVGGFATGAMFLGESFETVIRCRPMTIGEFYLDLDDKLEVDTLYRILSMTARQMAQKFGEDRLSARVKAQLSRKPSTRFLVLHVIQPLDPDESPDAAAASSRGRTYEGIYFEYQGEGNTVLDRGFYRTRPFVAPRWMVYGSNIYGVSPAHIALPDIKMLQRMEKDKLKGLAKMVDPPMKAGPNLKPAGGTIVPGGVTFVTDGDMETYTPSYMVNLNIAQVAQEIQGVQDRIRTAFFNDLFVSILQESKTMTAREIAERHDEKLLLLGPTLERLEGELLDTAIDRTFDIAWHMGLIPPPPEAIQGLPLQVEYVSLLAQAQKIVGLSSIEQLTGFAMNIAAVQPEVMDKLNLDETVEEYAEVLGVKPTLLRKEQEVAQIREQRAQAQAAQAAAERGMLAAQGAKNLSETKMDQNSALDRLMPGIGG